jgi:hypothetical protein
MQSHGAVDASSIYWHKSSLCQNGECVEIAVHNDTVVMRSSAEPSSAYIRLTPEEFGAFLREAKTGRFDLIAGRLF